MPRMPAAKTIRTVDGSGTLDTMAANAPEPFSVVVQRFEFGKVVEIVELVASEIAQP